MIYNYFMLTLIPCQIWLKFCSILCTLYFMWDFIVWIVCERECEDSRQHWRSKEFSQVTREKTSCEVSHVQHMTGMQRVMTASFYEYFAGKTFSRNTCKTFCFTILAYLIYYVFTHTIYTIITHILRWVSFKEKTLDKNPWELEIVIPTILYTILCSFPQLLPLHIQILERLISQTLTTPILSVKWGFGVTGKHWNKPFV